MTAIDPVCGMEVDEATAEWKTEYKGRTYYFCAPGCKRSFEKAPEQYLSGQGGQRMGPAGHEDMPGHDHPHSH